jgi:endonuclease/exonuclease/phosphatase family metal-dependent hydrolase
MQKSLLLFITALMLTSAFVSGQNQIKVLTWNLRFDNPTDKENSWTYRKEEVTNLMRFFQADIICTQEGLNQQVTYLKDSLKTHSFIGVGRDDGFEKGEYCAIFYRKSRFEVMEQETFWLSETPQKPSKGWDAAIVRICTWLKIKDLQSNSVLYVFNTHFDHMGQVAREKSAELILKKINEMNKENLPVILCGDFNATDTEKPYEVVTRQLKDTRKISQIAPFGPFATFNNFRLDEVPTERIDYIFVNEKIGVLRHAVLTVSKNNRYPSDHFPVFTELIIN